MTKKRLRLLQFQRWINNLVRDAGSEAKDAYIEFIHCQDVDETVDPFGAVYTELTLERFGMFTDHPHITIYLIEEENNPSDPGQ